MDNSDQFILGRDFVMSFDVMIDWHNSLIRIRNPDWKYEIELEEGAIPHREGARRIMPHKSCRAEAWRAEIEMLLEYDLIESSKSPWACGVVMAKKKGGSLVSVATFVT